MHRRYSNVQLHMIYIHTTVSEDQKAQTNIFIESLTHKPYLNLKHATYSA